MKNNIAEIRKNKGLTQKELAEIVGISHWWMNHIERGKRDPSLKMAQTIAEKLDVKFNDIFLD